MTRSTPRLSESARHLVFPAAVERSVYPRVEERLRSIGVRFDEWQRGFGSVALGLDGAGTFASSIGGVVASIPRQVGKTFTVGHLMVGLCLEFPNLRVIWTSHHLTTTDNTFQSMQGIVRNPLVEKYVAEIRLANGQQRIRFANGSVIMFGARSMGFGRGLDKVDVLVFDEAQILGLKALEDMVPSTNQAQNPHGGLLFFVGTPPRPTDDGEAFRAKRAQALSGKSEHMTYVEFSADPDAKTDDERQWPKMNPSYPSRTPRTAMLRMRENLPDEGAWRREAMGIWDEVEDGHERLMPLWDERLAAGPPARQRPVAFGIDRDALDGVSIVAAWHMSETHVHIEEVLATPSMDEAADFLAKAARIRDTIFIDAYSAAAPMVPLLQARKRKPLRSSAAEFVASCALLDDGIARGDITHNGDQRIAAQVKAAGRREVKGGGWAWRASESGAPIHVLTAAGLAVLGARRAPYVDPDRPGTRKTPTRSSARAVNARSSRSSSSRGVA